MLNGRWHHEHNILGDSTIRDHFQRVIYPKFCGHYLQLNQMGWERQRKINTGSSRTRCGRRAFNDL